MLGFVNVQFLEVSIVGARIAHDDPLRPGSRWTVELPAVLGGAILTARVVHSTALTGNRNTNGPRPVKYESGVEFVGLTADQEAPLARALKKFAPGAALTASHASP
jgi:hypothetical protein